MYARFRAKPEKATRKAAEKTSQRVTNVAVKNTIVAKKSTYVFLMKWGIITIF